MVHKKLMMSLLIVVAVIGLAGAGTFAYFDDQVSTAGNSIASGTLKLNDEVIGAVTLTVTGALPDSTAHYLNTNGGQTSFEVKNTGSTSGILTAVIPNDATLTGAGNFGSDMKIEILNPDQTTWQTIFEKGAPTTAVTLSNNFANGASFQESVRYTYAKTQVIQDQQAKTLGFKIQFELTQAH